MESEIKPLVVFRLDEQRYALPLPAVERVVRAVEVTPLPKAPAIVLGLIRVQRQIVPVLNVRKRFGRPDREIEASDHFLLAHTRKRKVALAADEALQVLECPAEELVPVETILPGLEYLAGVARCRDGLVLIHDLDSFLSLEEENDLREALEAAP